MERKYSTLLPQLKGERLQKFITVMRGHEMAEAYYGSASARAGVRGRFGSHASPRVIQAEFELASLQGKETLEDVLAYRRLERQVIQAGLEGPPTQLAQIYRSEMGPLIDKYARHAASLRKSEYIRKVSSLREPGVFHFPETWGASPAVPISVDESYKKFILNQGVRKGAQRSAVTGTIADKLITKGVSLLTKKNIIIGLIAAAGAYTLFSGQDDEYNTIEGLNELGLAAKQRKILTEFGSGYDKVRALAKMLGIGYEKFVKGKTFQSALSRAQVVKKIGKGSFADVELMRTAVAGPEGPELIQFARKTVKENLPARYAQEVDLLTEAAAMRELSATSFAPSVYGRTEKTLMMEYMPGKTVHQLLKEGEKLPSNLFERLKSSAETVAAKGIKNLDIHAGNIMYDPSTSRISWIDWGMASIETTRGTAVMANKAAMSGVFREMKQEIREYAMRPFAKTALPEEVKLKIAKRNEIDALATTELRGGDVNPAALLSRQLQEDQKRLAQSAISGGRGHLSRKIPSVSHSSIATVVPGRRLRMSTPMTRRS